MYLFFTQTKTLDFYTDKLNVNNLVLIYTAGNYKILLIQKL